MSKYESIIILNDKTTEESKDKVLNKIRSYIEENGKIIEIQEMGLKKLAYQIKECKEGYYVVINFYTEPDNVIELERIYRTTDEIIKFIVVKND